jgi:hypothetical protein
MVVTNLDFKHKVGCVPKTDAQFEVRFFLYKLKKKVKENPLIPTQQLYENQRTALDISVNYIHSTRISLCLSTMKILTKYG